MDLKLVFGLSGSVLSIVSALPQILKSKKRHSTENISFLMYAIRVVSCLCWIGYGVVLNATLLVVEASIVGCFELMMLVFIVRDKIYTST